MSWNVVSLEGTKPTPWRNGGGFTRELAAGPDLDTWGWRMSVAEVGSDGPFSRFVGVTRWFAVLHGAGVELSIDMPASTAGSSMTRRLTLRDAPLAFDGAVPTQCRLLDGPTQDFNLMVREESLPARMVRVNGIAHETVLPGKLVAIYTVDSTAIVRFDGEKLRLPQAALAWRNVLQAGDVQVECDHALWMELSA